MTTTLIVLAHPEVSSFNAEWANATRKACLESGDEVLTSNLVEMEFEAVESRIHYRGLSPNVRFDPLKVQEMAAAQKQLPADVKAEVDKLRRADRVVFHFPIWWFALPAVLKGWFDRVLAHGELHTVEQRFDTGKFRGRKALFCVTTGSSKAESSFSGREGDIQMLLWPAAYTLRYLGFSVLVPEIVHGIHGYHQGEKLNALQSRLRGVLEEHPQLMSNFDNRALIPFNRDSDFDSEGNLKSDRPSHSPFIRHQS